MAVYFNNQFIKDDEAKLHVSDLSIQRGYGVFDFLRSVRGVPLFMEDHLKRFQASAVGMHLPLDKNSDELGKIVKELLRTTELPEAGIRLMLTGGYSTNSYQLAKPNLVITCNPVKTATATDFEKGLKIITHEYQRELPNIKSNNYQMAVWLQPMITEKQVDDVLYHQDGIITECPRSNFFIVTKDNKLVTPANNILKGITRKNVLQLASTFMEVEERDIQVSELIDAAEVFLTSTTKKVLPVLNINGNAIGNARPGPATASLYVKFLELEKKRLSEL